MATSLNGWPAIPRRGSNLATGTVPGTKTRVTLQKDVLPVFLAFLADWHKTVHPIEYKGDLGVDGWSYRKARMANAFSNHSSGTAVDITYDWLKADRKRHMTAAQIKAVHRLLDKYVTTSGKRIFGWGGDWKAIDEMHVELIQSWSTGSHGTNCTLADVKNVMKRLKIQPDGTTPAAAKPTPVVKPAVVPAPTKPPGTGKPRWRGAHFVSTIKFGVRGDAVNELQYFLRVPITGVADKKTTAAIDAFVRAYNKRHPKSGLGKADGTAGPLTFKAITGHA